MTYGSKRQGAQILQRILDKYNASTPSEVEIPILLRTTARLLLSAIAEEQSEHDELLYRLCSLCKSVGTISHKHTTTGSTPSLCVRECKWFSKTIYNAALQNVTVWPAKDVIDLLHYSSSVSLSEKSLVA